jgi:hypothetical protein
MTMEKGLAIIDAPCSIEPDFVHIEIDQDSIEFAQLNTRTKKRIAKAEAEQREAERSRRRAEKAEAKRTAYNIATAKYILIRAAIMGAVTWAWTAGMIHPGIWIPVALFCLCTSCLRLGAWFGKGVSK